MSIDASVRYGRSPANLCDASKIITETCLERCSKTIESLNLKCESDYAPRINLMGMENGLYNLVKLDINIPTVADIDTLLRAAPRLKYLQLKYSDIKATQQLHQMSSGFCHSIAET
ncbi:hypothetical protein CLU79DRAFT_714880 [Phycomyces nitens]|nr:hypothetical protein CLU79DRAFT_714880 [Phycomyces nitens]